MIRAHGESLADAARAEALDLAWTAYAQIVTNRPRPKAVPHRWSYRAIRPLLERAGRDVGTDEAERRVLMLTNPALRAPFTTDTLYAGYQYILPGETARAHRHTAFALRFIVEGASAFTAVDGEKLVMRPGDLVLTPSWAFHDHGNESDAPMVWLDGLDVALYQWIPANFAEGYPEPRVPSSPPSGASRLLYPWDEMRAALDAAGGAFAERAYRDRESGEPISATLGAAAERVAGAGPRRQSTASAIYHVVAGSGSTEAGEATLTWERGDTFAIPAWTPYAHRSASAYLFRIDDVPLLRALRAYREAPPA